MKRRRKVFYEITDNSDKSFFWCAALHQWFPLGTRIEQDISSNRAGLKTKLKAFRAAVQLSNAGGEPILLQWYYYKGERYLREYRFIKPKR